MALYVFLEFSQGISREFVIYFPLFAVTNTTWITLHYTWIFKPCPPIAWYQYQDGALWKLYFWNLYCVCEFVVSYCHVKRNRRRCVSDTIGKFYFEIVEFRLSTELPVCPITTPRWRYFMAKMFLNSLLHLLICG